MKYVRTKDGIYEVKRETDITYELNTQNMVYRVYKFEVIKQANTIKELCDELVARNKKNRRNICNSIKEIQVI